MARSPSYSDILSPIDPSVRISRDEFADWLETHGKAASTASVYSGYVARISHECDNTKDPASVQAFVKDAFSRASRTNAISAWDSFVQYLHGSDSAPVADETAKAVAPINPLAPPTKVIRAIYVVRHWIRNTNPEGRVCSIALRRVPQLTTDNVIVEQFRPTMKPWVQFAIRDKTLPTSTYVDFQRAAPVQNDVQRIWRWAEYDLVDTAVPGFGKPRETLPLIPAGPHDPTTPMDTETIRRHCRVYEKDETEEAFHAARYIHDAQQLIRQSRMVKLKDFPYDKWVKLGADVDSLEKTYQERLSAAQKRRSAANGS